MRTLLSLAALLALAYVGLVVVANRASVPRDGVVAIGGADVSAAAQRRITLLNWNLGYAGLGAESEFIADGGNRLLAPSRAAVDKNLEGIKRVLASTPADVYTLQEAARTSYLNYWRPVWKGVQQTMPGTATVWHSDVLSLWVPWPTRLDHGLATLLRVRAGDARTVPLPLEPGYWLGLLRKQYALLVTRVPIAGQSASWVIVNLHLAAFDDKGDTRRKQLRAVTDFARAEFAKGNHVVLAGDWNMVLGGKEFPHQTDKRYLDWVHPMPPNAVPEGWRLVFDETTPSVRTLYKPYVAGENFVSIIDGYLVSPNVEVEAVRTIDLAFAYSDHHPIVATFRAK